MSSFLVLSEGDTRNRWRDGQVCPGVGQGTMAPWAGRLGCVLACYAQIERREKKDGGEREEEKRTERGDGKRKGSRRKKRRKIVGGEREEPALYGEKG
ncbi:hypothetical protein TNCV_3644151 [Trichonephila clavipes]|nr:hypothetical protein TNCV_3644151 [Trichonephila clavipes]